MTKINLLRRQAITIDEFRGWLNQLIQDKKGALPDLNDWKLIKEQLDKVGTPKSRSDDGSGYPALRDNLERYVLEYCFEPYDVQFHLDFLDKLCEQAEQMYDTGDIERAYLDMQE